MTEEIWVDLYGLEEYYQVSSHGRIWRKERVVVDKKGITRTYPGVLKTFEKVDFEGYYCLSYGIDGKRGRIRLHRAVALSFHGEPPEDKPLVRHLDGDKTNNREDNLEWGSVAENNADKLAHGEARTKRYCPTMRKLVGHMKDNGVQTIVIKTKFGISSDTVRRYLKEHRRNVA